MLGGGVRDDAGPGPGATSRHVERLEFGLRSVVDLDHLCRTALEHLTTLPGVARAGLGLTEGAGRRLRFVSSDNLDEPSLSWCHIDAYDDVPLTAVSRTGEPILLPFDSSGSRYADLVAHQRELGVVALAALPLPGSPSPVGGFILYFDVPVAFDEEERTAYTTAARRISDAIKRVRSAAQGTGHDLSSHPVEGTHRGALALDADPQAAGLARRFLRDKLAEWEVDDDIADTAQLCLSELVNNVIMHARTTSRLTVWIEEQQLTVMLRDLGGAEAPGSTHHHRPVTDTDEFRVFGRGLTLVDALTDGWGSHRDEIGTTAWFMFRLGTGAAPEQRTG